MIDDCAPHGSLKITTRPSKPKAEEEKEANYVVAAKTGPVVVCGYISNPSPKRSQYCPAKLFAFIVENKLVTMTGQNTGDEQKYRPDRSILQNEAVKSAYCPQPVQRGFPFKIGLT